MKERPILFTGPMVRAILEGRKTVTRRAVKHQPENGWAFDGEYGRISSPHRHKGKFGAFIRRGVGTDFPETDIVPCPYGMQGDRLWVRESWAADAQVDAVAPRDLSQGEPILYLADGGARQTGCSMIAPGKTRPSIHMPRWVSRLLLEIVSVRVERLQDITGDQAEAEGVERPENITNVDVWDGAERALFNAMNQPRDRFQRIWDDINGIGSWSANPWVWVVEFKRLEVAHG